MRLLLTLLLLSGLAASALAKDSSDHWFETRSPHFVVFTNSNEKQGRKIAGEFEQMRAVFQKLMPNASDNGAIITVLALKDKKGFQALEPAEYLAKGQLDLAGLFLTTQDKNYVLLRLDAQGEHPFATVYHEYTHFLMRNASEWIPLWLNEGLAEFYQNTDIHDKEVDIGQASAGDLLYLRQNELIPLETLLKVDHSSPYYHEEQKGSVFYAESWALTHFIEINDQMKKTKRMTEYADMLVRRVDPIVAAQKAFGDLYQLEKALKTYISQGTFMMFQMKSGVSVDEASFQSRAVAPGEVDPVRAEVLLNDHRIKDAQELLEATLRADTKNALADEVMGSLSYQQGDMAAAKKWYGEAVNLDSKSYLAHYYYAAITMRLGGADEADDRVESGLQKCIALNPEYAPAYDALARYYNGKQGKFEEAHRMNLLAISHDPSNLYYRFNAATVLMNARRYDDAATVLKTAGRLAKTPDQRASVERLMKQTEQGKTMVAQNEQMQKVAEQQAKAGGSVSTSTQDTRSYTITTSDGRKYDIKPANAGGPKYPTEDPTGVHHTARGVIHHVECSYPTVLTMTLDRAGKLEPMTLYRDDFYKIEFSVLNFTPKSDINPCTDIEGLKAKVDYAEVSDKSVGGQIVSVELSK